MSAALDLVSNFDPLERTGSVAGVAGQAIRVADALNFLDIGARVLVEARDGDVMAEVVGVEDGIALCLPFGPLDGVKMRAPVKFLKGGPYVRPSTAWLGRVIDGLGRPIDGKGPLVDGSAMRPLRASPPPAPMRARLGARIEFGVRALDCFTPALEGQRVGVFSGSGVGKSSLLGMIARNASCDVGVIALIGERGREVREFIEEDLGPEGLARTVVIVATSDEPALMRREAGYLAMTLSEHFRADGAHVLCLMDSLTRIAMAQREIGLAAGEPPTTKGYTPSVFSMLPALLERAGPGLEGEGRTTGVFTVLVEGDDHDEPIADAARAILDGHIVLDRSIAERGRFPAVDILRSTSRTADRALGAEELIHYGAAKAQEAVYEDMRELIRIGAYKSGANAEVDAAIAHHGAIEEFLTQSRKDASNFEDAALMLAAIYGEG